MVTGASDATQRGRSLINYRVVRRPRRDRILVALYGIVACLFAVHTFNAKPPVAFMTSRENDIAGSIAVLDRGGPPLLKSDIPYSKGVALNHLSPAGVTDDQGIYVYLPELAKATGEHDPAILMKWFFMGCFTLLVLLYPLMFYELFGSVAGAVLSPLLVLWRFDFTQSLDLYWILAWCMLLCIPGLALAYRWWPGHRRRSVVLLVVLMLAASFSTSIRIHSGLPILLGALGIVFTTGTRWWRNPSTLRRFRSIPRWWLRPAVAVALLVAYLSIGTIGMSAIRDYRNHVIHDASFGSQYPTQHPFWHNAYIGFGYLPNKYGIAWSDTVSADAVERAHPGTGFLTSTYENTLRHLYFQIVRNDPGFVINTFWTKARVLVADAVERFWLALILLPFAAFFHERGRVLRVALAVSVPAALFGALAPVLTIPYIEYELAWLGTWGALWIMAIVWGWTLLRDTVAADIPTDVAPLLDAPANPAALAALRARLRRSRSAWAAGVGILLAFVLTSAARPATPPSSGALYASAQGGWIDPSWLQWPAVASWAFDGSLPKGWEARAGAFTERDSGPVFGDGLYVRSPMAASGEQLAGPSVTLQPGSYAVAAAGRAIDGGFEMSAVSASGATLATADYQYQEPSFLSSALLAPFTVTSPTRVHVSFASWTSVPNSTSWMLWQVRIIRDDAHAIAQEARPDTSFYRAHALPIVKPTHGPALGDWSFAGGLPPEWWLPGQSRFEPTPTQSIVTTAWTQGAPEIASPPLLLARGSYAIDVRGSVLAGGIRLAVKNVVTGALLGAGGFWSGERFATGVMRLRFTVARAGTMQFELDNWGHRDHASMWAIRRVWLRRTP
jgi:hypothetical protein